MAVSRLKLLSLCLLVGVCLTAGKLSAATTIYTDRAAYDLATGGTLSFDDFSSGTPTGFTLASDAGRIRNGGDFRDRPTIRGETTTFTFGSAITAFGGDYDLSPGGPGIGLRFILSGGDYGPGGSEIVSQEISGTYEGFWGFVSDTFFTQVEVSGGSGSGFAETHTFDNFSFGIAAPVAPVPLPAGLWLLLSALGAAFGLRRLQRRQPIPVTSH